MPTLRQLRDRVKSLRNTQQITRAMKMVAGAKIRRAEQAMRASRPYAAAIADMLGEIVSAGGRLDHPLLQSRETKRSGVLVMTADKGLCGAFNSNLVRAAIGVAAASPGGEAQIYAIGSKTRAPLRRAPYATVANWPLGARPFEARAREVAARLSEDFLAGAVDAVTLVSSRFISAAVQRPTPVVLLPVPQPSQQDRTRRFEGGALKNSFEIEPDTKSVLAALLPKYLEFTIFQALLETQASEFAARLVAMTNATENAGKLIDELTIVMNKTRQASITKEILEIAGGAEALKG